MWKTRKYESIVYLFIGLYISTPGKFNIFYRIVNYFIRDASRTVLELALFIKLCISIIGAIIVISSVMELYNKIRDNEYA